MNMVLIHIGDELPPYIRTCIDQAKKFFPGTIYVVANKAANVVDFGERVKTFPIEHIPASRSNDFTAVGSFLKQHGGVFWEHAFRRMFLLEDFIRLMGLGEVLHIENDVMIYSNPESLGLGKFAKVATTPIGPKYVSYAYTYVPNLRALTDVNSANLNKLALGHRALNQRYGEGSVNEMMLACELAREGVIDLLPTIPDHSDGSSSNGCVGLFDGASAGQYLGGTNVDPPGWTGPHHYLGCAIKVGKYKPIMKDGKPYMTNGTGKETPLNNLHIHSKRLELFKTP